MSSLLIGFGKIDDDVYFGTGRDSLCIRSQHVSLFEVLVCGVGVANAFNPIQPFNAVIFNPDDIQQFIVPATILFYVCFQDRPYLIDFLLVVLGYGQLAFQALVEVVDIAVLRGIFVQLAHNFFCESWVAVVKGICALVI